jgi:dimethylargininase
MLIAITRQVSSAINQCELTHFERTPIDLVRARSQHHAYEQALRDLGVMVISMPEEPNLPDSVFVEDAAVVLDECAVPTRPGANSRQPEVESIARVLAPHRQLFTIQAPGTLDGGDVLTVGRTIFIGLSGRSNQAAIDQMDSFLRPFGYIIQSVPVTGCLHLKSAVTQVKIDTLLINPAWVEKDNFRNVKFIDVDPSEHYAANAVLVSESVLYQPVYPRTLERLEALGIHPILVDQSELGKAEGALTCCSLIFKA